MDEGGSSLAFFLDITDLTTRDIINLKIPTGSASARHVANDIAMHLEKFGPALVACFRVDEAFYGEGLSYLTSTYDALKPKGIHAMVMVGHRMEGSEHVFLLQNWWTKKPLVEVSASYLASTLADVVFVNTPLRIFSRTLPVVAGNYMECEADSGERLAYEGVKYLTCAI